MKILILVLFFVSVLSGIAEINQDSIYSVWKNTNLRDSTRANALSLFIGKGLLFSNVDSAYLHTKELMKFSEKNNLESGIADAYNLFGLNKILLGEYKVALDYLEKSLKISERLNDYKRQTMSIVNAAVVYDNLGQYSKAIEYNNKSIEIYKKIGDRRGLILSYNNIGIIYDNMGDNIKALDYYSKCLSLSKELNDLRGIAGVYMNMGLILSDQKNQKKALNMIEKSLEYAKLAKDPITTANAYSNLGYIHVKQNNFKKAFDNYNIALKMYIELNEKKGVASSLFNLGELKMSQNLYEDAIWYFNESLELYEELEFSYDLANNLNKNGISHLELGQINKAISNCKRGLEISESIGAIEIEKEACECLYNIYKKKEDSENALIYHGKMRVLVDSLKIEETSKKIWLMEFNKQLALDSIQNENAISDSVSTNNSMLTQDNNLRNIGIGSGIFFLFIGGGFYTRKRYKVIKDKKNNINNLES